MPPLPTSTLPRLLLVEGPDDKGICVALLKGSNLPDIHVNDRGGYQSLRPTIAAEIKVSGRTHIGIVVDADDSPECRWDSLADVLRPLGYDVPAAPAAEGVVLLAEGLPRLGLWLMPDNVSAGTVEDLIASLISDDDGLMRRAISAVAGIPVEERLFGHRVRKAEVHTWLAWQEEPGRPMGQAITKTYLDGSAVAAAPFRAWLQNLFG